MATTFGLRELYGGAITVELPVELIDSSDLRQIPDHQEVFLSPTTLTSIIFEVNNYVPGPDPVTTSTTTTTTASGITSTTTTTTVYSNTDDYPTDFTTEADLAAAAHHFNDVIALPDTLASPLAPAQRVAMVAPSLSQYPAYVLPGTIVSYEPVRRSQQGQQQQLANGAASSSSAPTPPSSLVHQLQLLVRLPAYETDLCVRINVPLKEIGGDEGEVKHEERFAGEVLQKIVGTLDIKDFGLFGTD